MWGISCNLGWPYLHLLISVNHISYNFVYAGVLYTCYFSHKWYRAKNLHRQVESLTKMQLLFFLNASAHASADIWNLLWSSYTYFGFNMLEIQPENQ